MRQVATAGVGDRQFAEDVVEDTGRHLDRVVAFDDARRLEAREGKLAKDALESALAMYIAAKEPLTPASALEADQEMVPV
jgi:hypothetical protein